MATSCKMFVHLNVYFLKGWGYRKMPDIKKS